MRKMISHSIWLFLAVLALGSMACAENWPAWRGPGGDGVSAETEAPLHWSADKNVLWKLEIPGQGHSTPIVWQDSVFLTTCVEETRLRMLICIDNRLGKIIWKEIVVQGPLEKKHNDNNYASGSPATDGQKVYVSFLDGPNVVVAAYDFSGRQIWLVRPGTFQSPHGFSITPVLYDGQVIINASSNDDDSFLAALDCVDGHTIWKMPQYQKTLSYSTPFVSQMSGRPQLILCGNKLVTSYQPDNGTLLWSYPGPSEEFISTPVYDAKHDLLFVASSYPDKKLAALHTGGTGDSEAERRAWITIPGCPMIQSPLLCGTYLFTVDQQGNANCLEAETGRLVWKKPIGAASPSPIRVGELVYLLNNEGVMSIIRPGPEFNRIAQNEINQTCIASPALSNGRLYIRGKTHLFCIGSPLNRIPVIESKRGDVPTLWIIGDSTVKNNTPGLMGWGDPIAELFDPNKITVKNRALGGRSSRTFLTEGLWQNVLKEMKSGDYVLVQFGHNDNGSLNTGRARASLHSNSDESQDVVLETTGKVETVHSYGWYLRRYIEDAKAKDVTPIILSLVPRNMWSDDGKTVNRAANDFALWASQAAKQGGADFVDLNAIIADRYEALGQDRVKSELFAQDHTHTTPAGARLNAACVVEGLKKLKSCRLCDALIPDAVVKTQ